MAASLVFGAGLSVMPGVDWELWTSSFSTN